jgi:predicted nucleic acid-binding protein
MTIHTQTTTSTTLSLSLSLFIFSGDKDLISLRTQATLEFLTPHHYFHTFPEGNV